ncbi:hypothetical protein [Alysiella crassa]|uniref:hypothetical protein n=1 Tax=Alysiella crassa TaxID=153491 RepID=UPI001FD07D32|nr:hypothetical protein [Alysiella crassa]UOP07012.1 hypothetical protein LVJ80_00510 [Alysiella crassa]
MNLNYFFVWLTFPKSKSPRGDRAHAVGKLLFLSCTFRLPENAFRAKIPLFYSPKKSS